MPSTSRRVSGSSRRPAAGRRLQPLQVAQHLQGVQREGPGRHLAVPAGRTDHPAHAGAEEVVLGLDLFPAHQAPGQFRPVSHDPQHVDIEEANGREEVWAFGQIAEGGHQQVEQPGLFHPLLGEAVHQLHHVVSVGGPPHLLPHAPEGVHRLALGDHVQLPPLGEEHLGVGELLHVAPQPRAGAPDALGHGAQLPVMGGVDGEDLVGLAEVAALQHNAPGSVDSGSFRHGGLLGGSEALPIPGRASARRSWCRPGGPPTSPPA